MKTGPLLETLAARLVALIPPLTVDHCFNPPCAELDDVLARLCALHVVPPELRDLYSTAEGEAGSSNSGMLLGMRFLQVVDAGRCRAEWAQEW